MNNTMKITSLVAVLALCCAALAGSAYAYTATYVDTIGEQPIQDVYLEVSSEKSGYGGYDLDLEYNTYKKGAGATYFALERATIANDVTAKFVETNGNTARYVLLIDTLTITARGDAAAIDTVTAALSINDAAVAGEKIVDNTYGATAFVYLSDSPLDSIDTVAGKTAYQDLTFDEAKQVAKDGTLAIYAYIIIDVAQLAAHADTDPVGYCAAAKTIGDFSIPEFDVAFVAHADQA